MIRHGVPPGVATGPDPVAGPDVGALASGMQVDPGIRLRPRTDADNAFIASVTRQELVPTLEQAWKFKWDDGHARKFMLDLLTIGDTLIVTRSRSDEQRLGYVWYIVQSRRQWLLSRSVFWINYLILARDAQGQGIGAQVMHYCLDVARRNRCHSVELWVQAVNEGARRFYEGLRFVPGRPINGNIPMQRSLRSGHSPHARTRQMM